MEREAAEQEPEGGMTMDAARPPAGEIIAVTTTTFMAQSYALNEAPPFGSLLRVAAPRPMAKGRLEAGGPDRLRAGASAGAPGIAVYYALCYGSQTGSIEPGRNAVAWGRFEDDEEDIYRRQPQLAQVLRTTFDALLVGYDPDEPDEPDEPNEAPPAGEPDVPGVTTPYRSNGSAAGASSAVASRAAAVTACGAAGRAPVQRAPAMPPRLHATVCRATPAETVRFNGNLAYLRFVLRAGLPLTDDFIAAAIAHAYEAGERDETFLLDAARQVARLLGAEHERVMNILELLDD